MDGPRTPRKPRSARTGTDPETAALAFYDPSDYRPDESVASLMRRILNAVTAEAGRELEPSGLTNAQWVPLFKLYVGAASTAAV